MLFWLSLILIALGLFIAFIPYFADKWIDDESHEKLHDFFLATQKMLLFTQER